MEYMELFLKVFMVTVSTTSPRLHQPNLRNRHNRSLHPSSLVQTGLDLLRRRAHPQELRLLQGELPRSRDGYRRILFGDSPLSPSPSSSVSSRLGSSLFSIFVVFLTDVGSVLVSAVMVGVALVCAHGRFVLG
ncbi:hypothetical protein Bca52824_049454 [Brassica carinata]|uniref:PRA1 family protein n=1 Tax=Brassica carinata TaxID=52824 RepID=A0A8X7RKD2_BRACI|nr:hypothetical protein Bca52824_049454 [Brassica carinata]